MNKKRYLSLIFFYWIVFIFCTSHLAFGGNGSRVSQTQSFLEDYNFLYHEIKNNYVNLTYKETLFEFSWDNLYQQYLPEIEMAETETDFFKICSRFVTKLKDGHSGFKIITSETFDSIYSDYYNVEKLLDIRFIENKPIIVRTREAFSEYLGNEIISINNIDFNTIVDTLLNYYYYAGNDFSSREKIVRYNFYLRYFDLFSEKKDTLTFQLRNRDGDISNLDIVLSAMTSYKSYIKKDTINFGLYAADQKPSYKILDNKIGYMLIPTFNLQWEDLSYFEDFFTKVATEGVKGVIFDIRYNPGGNQSFRVFLNYLADMEQDICYFRYRDTDRFHQLFPGRIAQQDSLHKTVSESTEAGYTKWWAWTIKPEEQSPLLSIPLVLLVNAGSFSSAESVANACLNYKWATVIGNMVPNSGFGLAEYVKLPSEKYQVKYSFHEGRNIDFSHTENTVKEPHIVVEQTVSDFDAGIDTQYEKAVEFITSQTGVKKTNHSTIKNFYLLPNYPNPFNSSTTIRYTVPEPNHVTLRVYNLQGREIQTLVNEFQTSDTYSIHFDAHSLTSGVYFYRIKIGSAITEKKKMIYLK